MAETTLGSLTVPPETADKSGSPRSLADHIYFPGLNGIRFIAAISVVFRHMEALKIYYGGSSQHSPDFFLYKIALNGDDAVTLFFVLSGFLITYLLLVEQRQTGTVHLKAFYARRTLRIWPLYYFMVFLAFVPLPLFEQAIGVFAPNTLTTNSGSDVLLKLREHVFFIPQVAIYFGRTVAGITQLWSIGVEEHFYLIWPVLAKRFMRHLHIVLLVIIVLKGALIWYAQQPGYPNLPLPQGIRDVIAVLLLFRVENMAVGGLGAYILFKQWKRLLQIIYHPITQIALIGVFIWIIVNWNIHPGSQRQFVLALPFMLFILNVASNPRSLIKLENRIFNRLGRTSYGIYMYHVMVMGVVLSFLKYTPLHDSGKDFGYNLFLYGLCTGLTLLVAHLSYEYFEKLFLRLKPRFTVVQSADHVDYARRAET